MSRKSNLLNIVKVTGFSLGLLFLNNSVHASGFALNDQSVTYLGNAYAGTSSSPQDASTGYYNPAGLGELKNSQIALSTTFFYQHIELYNGFAKDSAGNVITGNQPTKPTSDLIIPAGHIAWRVSKKWSLGLSVVEPFALDTKYTNQDIARLMATTNKISTVDISPTVGYKHNRYFSIGAGLDFLRTNTTISSGVAWGEGPEAGGFVINSGSDWSLGYHIGILLKPWCNTNVGLVYFSMFNPSFSGDTQSAPGLELDFGNPNKVQYALKLPDRINFSTTHNFNKQWAAMGEVEWTHWSRFKTMIFQYNSSALPGIKKFYYKNTWRVSLGTDFTPSPRWAIKAGMAYDESPTNDAFRNAMIPDSDRYLLAIGAKFNINKQISLVAGYSHVFFHNTYLAETGLNDALNSSPNVTNASVLNASVKNSGDIFGIQLVFNFV